MDLTVVLNWPKPMLYRFLFKLSLCLKMLRYCGTEYMRVDYIVAQYVRTSNKCVRGFGCGNMISQVRIKATAYLSVYNL